MGNIRVTNQAEPDTPATGTSEIYVDSGTKELSTKDDNGVVRSAASYTHPNHSGEVTSTGDGAQVLASTSVSNKTSVTAAATDEVLISDASDSGNLKKVTAQSIADLGGGGGGFGAADWDPFAADSVQAWKDDFLADPTSGPFGNLGWVYNIGTGGNILNAAATDGEHGVLRMTSSTTSGRNAGISLDLDCVFGGTDATTVVWKAKLGAVPSSAENLHMGAGITDSSITNFAANGCYFNSSYVDGATNFNAITEASGVRTVTDTGIPYDTAYHVFRVEVNAAWDSVAFYIDGALVATNTTNIPTSVTLTPVIGVYNSNGTAAKVIDVDMFYMKITNTASRGTY